MYENLNLKIGGNMLEITNKCKKTGVVYSKVSISEEGYIRNSKFVNYKAFNDDDSRMYYVSLNKSILMYADEKSGYFDEKLIQNQINVLIHNFHAQEEADDFLDSQCDDCDRNLNDFEPNVDIEDYKKNPLECERDNEVPEDFEEYIKEDEVISNIPMGTSIEDMSEEQLEALGLKIVKLESYKYLREE